MSDRDFNKDGQTYFELKEYEKAIECFGHRNQSRRWGGLVQYGICLF